MFAFAKAMKLYALTENVTVYNGNHYGLRNPPFHYHGISLNGAEIMQARREASRQEVDPAKVMFDQLSFDDLSLGKSSYSAVLAIESLTFSRNLTATLSNLSRTLTPGGILIVVDDFLTGHARVLANGRHKSNMKHAWLNKGDYASFSGTVELLASLSEKSTLLSDDNLWVDALDAAGLYVKNITDLDFFFDLPQIREEELDLWNRPWKGVKESRHPKLYRSKDTGAGIEDRIHHYLEVTDALVWKVNRALRLLDYWPFTSSDRMKSFTGSNARISIATPLRRISYLWFESIRAGLTRIQRKKAYQEGHLNYLMLVCQKPLH